MVIVAVDWSGAKARGGARDIALAEVGDGRLVDIRVGVSRADVERWLLMRAASTPEMVVGLDFAFSLPAWFARERLDATSVDDVWASVEAEGEQWLDGSAPWPFWGRGERPGTTGLPADRALRHTDRDVAVLTGAQPKSVFQLVGSGQVGPGSIRGMPMLRRLRAQGFAVWPFDAFSVPLLVEIYPRVFTGNVVKSSSLARQRYLSLLGNLGPGVAAEAAASEHAFDAACSALAMARQVETFEQLAAEPTPYDIEGKMFVAAPLPALRPGAAQAGPDPPVITPVRTRVPSESSTSAPANAEVPTANRPMVRVMRTSVTGLDDVPTDELHERIEKVERILADPTQIHLRSAAERTLRGCRRALEPDFAHTKVHHRSECWFVDRYEEGRFAGGAKRKFVLVPADVVPDGVGGCQYCESGRPLAVRQKQAGAGGSTPSLAARSPLSQADRETGGQARVSSQLRERRGVHLVDP